MSSLKYLNIQKTAFRFLQDSKIQCGKWPHMYLLILLNQTLEKSFLVA